MANPQMKLPKPVADCPSLRFLLSGNFTDFHILTRGYCFKVHRAIIAGHSPYFEKVCGGVFQEAEDACVNLDEEPLLMATFILGLYQGSYCYDDYLLVTELMDKAFMLGGYTAKVSHDIRDHLPHKLHGAMFRLSEYFETTTLRASSAQQFDTAINSDETPLTLSALIDAIDTVYNEHATIDDSLRAKITYLAQNASHDLARMPEFASLFHATPAFAWDFATQYLCASWLYCQICCKRVTLKDCDCGLRGICGQKNCVNEDVALWTCKTCGKTGELVRDDGANKHEGDSSIGKQSVKDSYASLGTAIVKSPTRTRRDI